MEKFLFLFRGGNFRSQSPEVMQAHMQKWFAWMEALNKKEIFVGSEPLQPVGRQLSGKNKTVTDGPFIEAKEMVGGYTIVLAKDINEATEIAKDCPIFEMDGKLEIRPIQKM